MEAQQQQNKFREFLETATAKMMSDFVYHLETEEVFQKRQDCIRFIKIATFLKMESELGIYRHTWRAKNSKRYPTEFLLDSRSGVITLFVCVRDSRDLNSMYARLYDEHKDQLLQWIDDQQGTDRPEGSIDVRPLNEAAVSKC